MKRIHKCCFITFACAAFILSNNISLWNLCFMYIYMHTHHIHTYNKLHINKLYYHSSMFTHALCTEFCL